MAREQEAGQAKTLLLALLVVVATGASIYFLGGGEQQAPDEQPQEEEVLELAPVIPGGAIKQASWRTGAKRAEADEEDEGDDGSLLDDVKWSDETEAENKFEKSLEETMDEIHGLGVYIDREDSEDKKKKADK